MLLSQHFLSLIILLVWLHLIFVCNFITLVAGYLRRAPQSLAMLCIQELYSQKWRVTWTPSFVLGTNCVCQWCYCCRRPPHKARERHSTSPLRLPWQELEGSTFTTVKRSLPALLHAIRRLANAYGAWVSGSRGLLQELYSDFHHCYGAKMGQ